MSEIVAYIIAKLWKDKLTQSPKIVPEKIRMDGGAGSPPGHLPITSPLGPRPIAPIMGNQRKEILAPSGKKLSLGK